MIHNTLRRQLAFASCLALSMPLASRAATETPADLVITNAKIYTADASHTMAQALAVRGGKLVWVGSTADAQGGQGCRRYALDAYTINGARFLSRDAEAGSLEAGKSADFVIVNQDILSLADHGDADRIATTRVLETWFQGTRVYKRSATAER